VRGETLIKGRRHRDSRERPASFGSGGGKATHRLTRREYTSGLYIGWEKYRLWRSGKGRWPGPLIRLQVRILSTAPMNKE